VQLTIYVPRPGSSAAVVMAARSAIVGGSTANGMVDCHYEGALYGEAMTFSQKLRHAAGRRVERYPTSARRAFRKDELEAVGAYDAVRMVVTSVEQPGLLVAWSGESVEAIRGRILPCGNAAWDDVSALGRELSPLARRNTLMAIYKTRAGQVVEMDAIQHTAFVHDVASADVPALLARYDLDEDRTRSVLGIQDQVQETGPRP
jgi:hypothetical protein